MSPTAENTSPSRAPRRPYFGFPPESHDDLSDAEEPPLALSIVVLNSKLQGSSAGSLHRGNRKISFADEVTVDCARPSIPKASHEAQYSRRTGSAYERRRASKAKTGRGSYTDRRWIFERTCRFVAFQEGAERFIEAVKTQCSARTAASEGDIKQLAIEAQNLARQVSSLEDLQAAMRQLDDFRRRTDPPGVNLDWEIIPSESVDEDLPSPEARDKGQESMQSAPHDLADSGYRTTLEAMRKHWLRVVYPGPSSSYGPLRNDISKLGNQLGIELRSWYDRNWEGQPGYDTADIEDDDLMRDVRRFASGPIDGGSEGSECDQMGEQERGQEEEETSVLQGEFKVRDPPQITDALAILQELQSEA
jgi:hypothetical protein